MRQLVRHRRPPDASAFTLVELLVVLAVIGTLTALLVPALAGARGRARQAACAATLRQWGLAVHAYADLFDGWLPRRGQGVNPTQQIDRPTDWFNALPPLMNQPSYDALASAGAIPRPGAHSVFSCPEAVDNGQANFWSFGMNMWLSVWNNGTTDVPDRIDFVGPQVSMVFLADGPSAYCSVSPAPARYGYSPVARHLGKVNICFLDAHVESFAGGYVGCDTGFVEHGDICWRVPGSSWDNAQH